MERLSEIEDQENLKLDSEKCLEVSKLSDEEFICLINSVDTFSDDILDDGVYAEMAIREEAIKKELWRKFLTTEDYTEKKQLEYQLYLIGALPDPRD